MGVYPSHGLRRFSAMIALSLLLNLVAQSQVDAAAIKDPTKPPSHLFALTPKTAKAKHKDQTLNLTSIYLSSLGNSAIINGRRVKTGDTVADARVIRIELNGVRMYRNGSKFKVSLVPLAVKIKTESTAGGKQ